MFKNKLNKLKRDCEKDAKKKKKEQEQMLAPPPVTPRKSITNLYSSPVSSSLKNVSPNKASNATPSKPKRNLTEALEKSALVISNTTALSELSGTVTSPPKKRKISVDEIKIEKVTMVEYQPLSPSPNSDNQVVSQFGEHAVPTTTITTAETSMLVQKQANEKLEKPICSQARKKEIGNWGEALVYKKLKESASQATTVWHNEASEQGLPYDISQSTPETQKKYYEVKTTVDSMKSKQKKASFSKRQVATMAEAKDNYTVVRVYNAETAQPSIKLINNPYQKIFHPVREEKGEAFKPAFPIVGLKLKI